jgi:hypothetical protein
MMATLSSQKEELMNMDALFWRSAAGANKPSLAP